MTPAMTDREAIAQWVCELVTAECPTDAIRYFLTCGDDLVDSSDGEVSELADEIMCRLTAARGVYASEVHCWRDWAYRHEPAVVEGADCDVSEQAARIDHARWSVATCTERRVYRERGRTWTVWTRPDELERLPCVLRPPKVPHDEAVTVPPPRRVAGGGL